MPEEARGLPNAKTGDGEELVVLLGLCLTEGLDECRLDGEVLVFSQRSQDVGLDLACGDVVDSRHDMVVLREVGHDRGLTAGELASTWENHTAGRAIYNVGSLRATGCHTGGAERWPGHPQWRETCSRRGHHLASLKSNAPKSESMKSPRACTE